VGLVTGGHLVDEGAGLREAGHDGVLHLDALMVRGDGDDIFDREGATIENNGHDPSLEARPVGVNACHDGKTVRVDGMTRCATAARYRPRVDDRMKVPRGTAGGWASTSVVNRAFG
jgi:hypothetical protein